MKEFHLKLVAFDNKNKPHPFTELPKEETKRAEFMPVLVELDVKGRLKEWIGPLWISDPERHYDKRRYLTEKDLVRMKWYAFKKHHSGVGTDPAQTHRQTRYYYSTKNGDKVLVPEFEGKLLFDIRF